MSPSRAVAQHEHIEPLLGAQRDQLLGDALDGGGDAGRIFLVDGEQQRRAHAINGHSIELGDVAPPAKAEEAEHGAAGAERNPGKAHRAEHKENTLQHGELHDGQDLVEQVREGGGGDAGQGHQQSPRPRQAIAAPARSLR